MSSENVEVIRRMYDRWLRGDPSVFDAFDEEIELQPDPAADWVGVNDVYRGHEGVRRYMAQVYEAFDDYRPEVEDFLAAEDKVITLAIEHGRGRGSGARVEARRTAHVWTMRAKKAVRLDLYLDRERAFEATGLHPSERHPSDDLLMLPFGTREGFEAWLDAHHADEPGLWVKFAKKGRGIDSITLDEATEVALCFGWIDSKLHRVDDDYYVLRYSPRRPTSNWSKPNKERVERLIAEGRMRPAGLAEVEAAKADGRWDAS